MTWPARIEADFYADMAKCWAINSAFTFSAMPLAGHARLGHIEAERD